VSFTNSRGLVWREFPQRGPLSVPATRLAITHAVHQSTPQLCPRKLFDSIEIGGIERRRKTSDQYVSGKKEITISQGERITTDFHQIVTAAGSADLPLASAPSRIANCTLSELEEEWRL
jgi:hypothetical protein